MSLTEKLHDVQDKVHLSYRLKTSTYRHKQINKLNLKPEYCVAYVSKSAIKLKIMITAKELFDQMLEENDECTSTEMMIAFAKLHVEEALKQAYIKAESRYYHSPERYVLCPIEEKSIITAYSLDGIV